MHDPHLFRVFEFDQCFRQGNFPCRWAGDSGKGFGEPLFNFYGQFPYWLTQIFILSGFSIINSTKIIFILSLVLSAVTMFLLARSFWGDGGGLISAVFYVYAPYRSVDVWVRGALPEALAFVLYPLILLFLDSYIINHKSKNIVLFSLSLSILILTHNLSFIMFAPFLALFTLIRLYQTKSWGLIKYLFLASVFSFLLSAFYLLPVLYESRLVTLNDTVKGYYDFRIHYTTLNELFISRFWGYGASLWQKKFLSVSIGHLHWILPMLILVISVFRKKLKLLTTNDYLLMTIFGFAALFLTHGKSSFIWNSFPFIQYIQFPWRFLSIAVFFLSLSAGYIGILLKNKFLILCLLISCILINYSFFRPDIWKTVTDRDWFSGSQWDENRSTSLTDFWPVYGPSPTGFAFSEPIFSSGYGRVDAVQKQNNLSFFRILVVSDQAEIVFPITYFPGWKLFNNTRQISIYPNQAGLITARLPVGGYDLNLKFTDTPVRSAGNIISLLSLFSLPLWLRKKFIG